jgi:GntR family transcriptional regulator, transcriptional repressor for pyruvate dehydrogenase complex
MIDKIISLLEDKALAKSPKRIREILEFRYILEPEIAALAAKSLNPKDLARIKTILDTQEKNLLEDKEDAEDDLHFHMALARATKNDVLVEVAAVLYDVLSECRVPPLQNLTRKKVSLHGHQEIYAALRERDSELSRMAMRNHLSDVQSLLFGQSTDTST